MGISFWRTGAEPKLFALPVNNVFQIGATHHRYTVSFRTMGYFFFVISVELEELVDKIRGTV